MDALFTGVLDRVEFLQDALVGAAVGALLGKTIASRRERPEPGVKAPPFALRWTWVGTGIGVLIYLIFA
jgi:hypothetical protein